ncbi:MAG: hypothetical protein ACYTFG_08860 [Planctomycetota bacterium]|jgi:hypothetical protein
MKASDVVRIGLSAALFLALFPLGAAGEETPKKKNGGKLSAEELKRYEIIKYINPFSPEPPKKPSKPKPKVEKKAPPPPKKVKVLPDNLHFCGVTYDRGGKSYQAMVNVDGKGTKFLTPGGKIGAWEVRKVSVGEMEVRGKDAKSRTLKLGTRFHDGVTVHWRTEGGGKITTSTTSKPKSPSAPAPKIDDAKRREIIERLKARRAAARRSASGK